MQQTTLTRPPMPSIGAKNNLSKFLNRMQSKPAVPNASMVTTANNSSSSNNNKRNIDNNAQEDTDTEMSSSSSPSRLMLEALKEIDNSAIQLTPAIDRDCEMDLSLSLTPNLGTLNPSSNIITTNTCNKLNKDTEIDNDIEMELTPPATPPPNSLTASDAFDFSTLRSNLDIHITNPISLDTTEMDIDNDIDSQAIFATDMECTPTEIISGTELQFLREKGRLQLLAAETSEENDVDMKEKNMAVCEKSMNMDMDIENGNNSVNIANNLGLNEIERGKVGNARRQYFARKELEGRDVEMSDVGFGAKEIPEFDMITGDGANDDHVDDLVSVLALF